MKRSLSSKSRRFSRIVEIAMVTHNCSKLLSKSMGCKIPYYGHRVSLLQHWITIVCCHTCCVYLEVSQLYISIIIFFFCCSVVCCCYYHYYFSFYLWNSFILDALGWLPNEMILLCVIVVIELPCSCVRSFIYCIPPPPPASLLTGHLIIILYTHLISIASK